MKCKLQDTLEIKGVAEIELFANGKEIKGVEIFKTGKYRDIEYTTDDLDKMVENFNSLKDGDAKFEPPVRIGHRDGEDSTKDANSIAGYIGSLYRKGKSLFADLDITEPDAFDKIKRKTLKNRSSEIGPYEDNKGKIFDKVIWGVAFVDIPQVEGMAEVKVYSKDLEKDDGDSKIDYVKEAKEYIELDKHDDKKSKKLIDELKNVSKKGIEDDRFFDAQEVLGLINSVRRILDTNIINNKKEGENMDKKEMEKKGEVVELSKVDHAELVKKAETADKLSKEAKETELLAREAKVETFKKDGKSISESDAEKAFVKTLDSEQYEKYCELKDKQPKLIQLDNEAGTSDDGKESEKETEAEKEKKKAVEVAEKLTKPHREAAEKFSAK